MKYLRHAALVAFSALALALPAKSAVVNVNEVIDLDVWAANGFYYIGSTDYTISDGDTVNITYSFANGKAIVVTNSSLGTNWVTPAWPWLYATNTSGNFGISNTTANLNGAIFTGGSGTTTYTSVSETSGAVHLGPYASFSVDGLTTLEFSGLSATFTVDYIPQGTGIYNSWLTNWATALPMQVVNSSASVPDTGSTLALFGLGLASLAFVRRKR